MNCKTDFTQVSFVEIFKQPRVDLFYFKEFTSFKILGYVKVKQNSDVIKF